MKKTFWGIMAVSLMMTMLTGCGSVSESSDSDVVAQAEMYNSSDSDAVAQAEMYNALSSAETFFDLAEYMTFTADDITYSECDARAALMPYFDLLLFESDKYIIVTQGNASYVLFRYCYSDYSSVVSAVGGFGSAYHDGRLYLTIDKTVIPATDEGCEPLNTFVNCIVQLEEDIDGIVLTDTVCDWEQTAEYSPYAGGWVQINKTFGVVDSELNLIVPVRYDHIFKDVAPDTGKVYYQLSRRDEGAVLTDETYTLVLHQLVRSICYVNENRFVVLKGLGDDKTIGLIDADETPLHDEIEGWLDGGGWNAFRNYAQQAVLVRPNGNKYLRGVLDSELNIIIEPIYDNISVFSADNERQFYVVENGKEEFAVIDASGVQKTEFERTSVYDVQTKYYQSLNS